MKIQEKIDRRLKKIYEEFRKDTGDKTGWSLMQKLKKEAGSEEGLIQCFIYEIFKVAYKKGEVINIFNLLANLIIYPYHKESYLDYPSPYHKEGYLDYPLKKDKNIKEVFPRLFLEKGVLSNILESLQLEETQKAFYYYLIVKDEEINEKDYLSEEQISEFKKESIYETRVLDIFSKEYKNKKLDKEDRIIKINATT